MPVLNFGDVAVPLYTTQMSSPSLKVMDSKGAIYYIPLIGEDGCVATGTKELYYEESSFNTCKTLTLPAGCYSIELRGGFGGGKCNASDDAEQTPEIVRYNLRIQKPIEISLMRGGDGNSSELTRGRGVGGGASGVASFIVAGDKIIESSGGNGERCTGIPNAYNINSASTHCSVNGTYGGAGGTNTSLMNAPGIGAQSWCSTGGLSVQEIITYTAPAGGGATSGNKGVGRTYTDDFASYIATEQNGSPSGGGNGGGLHLQYNGVEYTATGGQGGATVSYSCGGHTVYSYGGGGAGGVCYRILENDKIGCFDGADGASGSTNTSETSFIKIYRL